MGLFGSSKRKTAVTTTTSTSMGDIGITGQNAVDLASVYEMGSIERAEIYAGTLETLFSGASQYAQQLVGGASNIMEDASNVVSESMDVAKTVIHPEQTNEYLPYLILAGFGFLFYAVK